MLHTGSSFSWAPSQPDNPTESPVETVLWKAVTDKSWPRVLARLRTHPEEASQLVNGNGVSSLPLHEACKVQPPDSVVRPLIAAYKKAVTIRGLESFLPLHFAVRFNSTEAVIALLEDYPGGAGARDDKGRLPIHLGCQWGASADTIDRLLMIYPESIYVQDEESKVPMEYAETMEASLVTKNSTLALLECAPTYCAVTEAGKFPMCSFVTAFLLQLC